MPKFAAKAAKKAEVKAKAMEDKRAKWADARPVRPSLLPSLPPSCCWVFSKLTNDHSFPTPAS